MHELIPDYSRSRYFTPLKFRDLSSNKKIQARYRNIQTKKETERLKTMRYAAYLRVSSEEQVGNY